jgi:ribonuclease HI
LFDPSRRPAPANTITAIIDGAARGNPGPAAYEVVFENPKKKVVGQLSGRLGKATNNVAEYRALLAALSYALDQGWKALKVCTDSQLLARQVQGDFKVKSPDLKPLHDEAQQLISTFDYFLVEAVPRRQTRVADKLANAALDRRRGKSQPVPKSARTGRKTIRAVYKGGVLKPLEPLDLPDGTRVEFNVRRTE